jgi:predicted XRE-type DNA-binding protein
MAEEMQVYPSSGNVFADLGLPNPDELLLKAQLAAQIGTLI